MCQQAFEQVKAILYSDHILAAPDFGKQFKLAVDASDVGVGSVLQQEDGQGIDHPLCFFLLSTKRSIDNRGDVGTFTLIKAL